MENIVTKEGLEKLKKELDERVNKTRRSISDDIEEATKQGDLSENAAYHSALENKEYNENRIALLTELIKNAEVVDKKISKNQVSLGSVVEIENLTNNNKLKYEIVGQTEADPKLGKISIVSPIGAALNGKKVNDIIKIDSPMGEMMYKILKIS